MDSAKEHVSKFLHGSGKHTADLHSKTNAPVTHEHVKSTQEENVSRAVDREVHHEHHQTEVQPVYDQEVRATEHHHNVLPTEKHHEHHGHDTQVKEKLGQIAGAFGNKQHVAETQHVQGDQNEIVGEHHHHHVHHTVQPVIKKETIQPHVVHTTVPVHERVDLEPTVHGASVNKPMSMDQFKQQAGVGGGARHENIQYQGDPLKIEKDANVGFRHGGQSVDPSHQSTTSTGLTGSHQGTGMMTGGHHGTGMTGGHHGGATTGATAAAMSASQHHGTGTTGGVGQGNDYQSGTTGVGQTGGLGHRDNTSTGVGHQGLHDNTHGTTGHGQGHSSMLDPSHRDKDSKMPGEFVHDTSDRSGTHGTHGTGNSSAAATGFMDGRSPNDNKATSQHDTGKDEKSGGLISGLINKMKS